MNKDILFCIHTPNKVKEDGMIGTITAVKLNVKGKDLQQFLNRLFNHNSYDYVVVYKCEGDSDVYSIEAHHIGETK